MQYHPEQDLAVADLTDPIEETERAVDAILANLDPDHQPITWEPY